MNDALCRGAWDKGCTDIMYMIFVTLSCLFSLNNLIKVILEFNHLSNQYFKIQVTFLFYFSKEDWQELAIMSEESGMIYLIVLNVSK